MLTVVEALTLSFLPGQRPGTAAAVAARGAAAVMAHPREHGDILSPAAVRALEASAVRRKAEIEMARALAAGVALVPLGPDYPAWLARTADPPPVLWVKGRIDPAEGQRSVSLVGSRAASPEGRALARGLGRDLAAAGFCIVSGLARGIDGEAHAGALEAAGRSIGVLGSGLDRMYPPEHAALSDALLRADGAIVSECPLGQPPRPAAFPRRNRIIAGWGRGVVVIEASTRSGALGTARAALDEGREVMAVPGPPSWPTAAGPNALIRDGAVLVRDAADVALELGVELPVPPFVRRPGCSASPDPVQAALRRDAPARLEELATRSGLGIAQVLARLTELELRGRVRRLPGALFVATS